MTRRLYILNLGWMETDEVWILGAPSASRASRPGCTSWIKVPNLAFLIEDPTLGWVLFDSGSHPEAMDGHWPRALREISPLQRTPEQSLEHQLSLVGIGPEDVDLVVLSHLHMDHAGGLGTFAGLPAGDGVLLHRAELAHALVQIHSSSSRRRGGYLGGDFDLPGIRFEPVDRDTTLTDGLRLMSLPGHTPGLLGVDIDLAENGRVLCPSDAVYERRNLGPPVRRPGEVHDSLAYDRTIARLQELDARSDTTLIFSHDQSQAELLRYAPDCYE